MSEFVKPAAHEALNALAQTAQALSCAPTVHDVRRVVRTAARRLTGADHAALVLGDGNERACRPRYPHSRLTVPIAASEELGVIAVYWRDEHVATEEETALTRTLAASTAVALERLRVVEQLARSARENVRLAAAVQRRRSTEDGLRELCERDPLTGLLNRRAWDMALSGSLRKRRRPLYVALMDLDHFKVYNDRHGHPAGDALLQRAAVAWRGAQRTADVLARYGGDEFAMLLAGCSADSALEIVDRVRLATVDGETVSVGVAAWKAGDGADSIVARADRALYAAKRAGRDRVVPASL